MSSFDCCVGFFGSVCFQKGFFFFFFFFGSIFDFVLSLFYCCFFFVLLLFFLCFFVVFSSREPIVYEGIQILKLAI